MTEAFKEFEQSVRFLIDSVSMPYPTYWRIILFVYFEDFFDETQQVRRLPLQVSIEGG